MWIAKSDSPLISDMQCIAISFNVRLGISLLVLFHLLAQCTKYCVKRCNDREIFLWRYI